MYYSPWSHDRKHSTISIYGYLPPFSPLPVLEHLNDSCKADKSKYFMGIDTIVFGKYSSQWPALPGSVQLSAACSMKSWVNDPGKVALNRFKISVLTHSHIPRLPHTNKAIVNAGRDWYLF